MKLGFSLIMIPLDSDLKVIEFLEEVEYYPEACEVANSLIKDPVVLDELVNKIQNRNYV